MNPCTEPEPKVDEPEVDVPVAPKEECAHNADNLPPNAGGPYPRWAIGCGNIYIYIYIYTLLLTLAFDTEEAQDDWADWYDPEVDEADYPAPVDAGAPPLPFEPAATQYDISPASGSSLYP
jgi:hypothetical protein